MRADTDRKIDAMIEKACNLIEQALLDQSATDGGVLKARLQFLAATGCEGTLPGADAEHALRGFVAGYRAKSGLFSEYPKKTHPIEAFACGIAWNVIGQHPDYDKAAVILTKIDALTEAAAAYEKALAAAA